MPEIHTANHARLHKSQAEALENCIATEGIHKGKACNIYSAVLRIWQTLIGTFSGCLKMP